jgi:hypothetical protein
MDEIWFTGVADELARCLLEAEACALACEALLAAVEENDDPELRRTVVSILIAPAAIARALVELIDQPPRLVLAATTLCRESTLRAAGELAAVSRRLDCAEAIDALRVSAASCARLLEVA